MAVANFWHTSTIAVATNASQRSSILKELLRQEELKSLSSKTQNNIINLNYF